LGSFVRRRRAGRRSRRLVLIFVSLVFVLGLVLLFTIFDLVPIFVSIVIDLVRVFVSIVFDIATSHSHHAVSMNVSVVVTVSCC
jgi:cytochrome c biogenesis protein CcdA